MPSVALLLADRSERAEVVAAAAGRVQFRCYDHVSSLEREIQTKRPDGVLYEPGLGLAESPCLVHAMETLGIGLTVRLTLTPSGIGELLTLLRSQTSIGVSVRGVDSGAIALAAVTAPDPGPVSAALTQITDLVSVEAWPSVVAAIVLGDRRANGAYHSRVLGMRPRTLQAYHRRLALPHPKRLRGWGLVVWAAWRIQRRNATCKQAAIAGGFGRSSALSAVLRPVVGVTVRELSAHGGWTWALSKFRHELQVFRELSASSSREKMTSSFEEGYG